MNIRLSNISFAYESIPILKNLDADFSSNTFSSLLGPSGSGKSSLIKIIAGTLRNYTGELFFDNEEVSSLSPAERKVGWVPQDQLLFPNLTARQNIGYGLSRRQMSKIERDERINEVAELLGVRDLTHRYPSQLSGGEKQRVALCRAIAPRPNILLLDEPFSSLDAPLREKMALLFKKIHLEMGVTTIHVTHSPTEAELISDQTLILHRGKIRQSGPFSEIWDQPKSMSIAQLISRPNVVTHASFLPKVTSPVIIPDEAIQLESGDIEALVVSKTRDRLHLQIGNIQLQKLVENSSYETGQKIYLSINSEKIITLQD